MITVFDVSVNGRKLCRAGVGRDGVLNAIVSWVRLAGPAAANARRLKTSEEETSLHVGGLAGDTHRHWPRRTLKPGDRVVIERGLAAGDRVVTAGNFMIDSESRMKAPAAMAEMVPAKARTVPPPDD